MRMRGGWLLLLPAAVAMRVAVLGGGLAGLGTAVPLLDGGADEVHVYDAEVGPGLGGASAVAAGLLHPFTPKGREIWMGQEGFAATSALLQRCEAVSSERVSEASGLLRLALDHDLASELERASRAGGAAAAAPSGALEQRWISASDASAIAGATVGAGVEGVAHAPSALRVDTPAYLRALWALCGRIARERGSGLEWRCSALPSLAAVAAAASERGEAPYDAVVVCLGSRASDLAELSGLPLRPCRGQNLHLENRAGLETPLICGKYIVPTGEGGDLLLCGATFEYDPEGLREPPSEAEAAAALLAPLEEMLPSIRDAPIVRCDAGVRALPPRSHFGYVPLVCKLPVEVRGARRGDGGGRSALGGGGCAAWLFGGLGSRGLIHHAVLGRSVAEAVLACDESSLPEHTRRLDARMGELLVSHFSDTGHSSH